MSFRDYTPIRRNITATPADYKDHRADLRLDYKRRCGYCNDLDEWRFVWFEIDHLVPRKYWVTIKESDYRNLVYACRSCNNAKRAKWPTKDETIHNLNDEGFIDPCHVDYNSQFSRSANGRIVAQTKLGDWIYKELKFYKPQHEIIWNIEQLDLLIDEIQALIDPSDRNVLSDRLLESHKKFRSYVKQLSAAGF